MLIRCYSFVHLTLHQSNRAALYAKSRRSMSRPSSAAYTALATRKSQDVDDDDEDTQTLIGSPPSPEFIDDKNSRGNGHIEHSRHSRQPSINKGNAKTHLEAIEEEEFLNAKDWGFWEVCAVRTVRRMLASLFLLS